MVIRQAYAEDEGTYLCIAQNVAGKSESKCIVTIESNIYLRKVKCDITNYNSFAGKEKEPATEPSQAQQTDVAPVFSKVLTPLTIEYGCKINLDVVVCGEPKPKLYWFYEKKKIRDSRHVKIVETQVELPSLIQVESALEIDSAQEQDSGKYSVRAINRSGVKSTSVNLVVKGDYHAFYSILLYP